MTIKFVLLLLVITALSSHANTINKSIFTVTPSVCMVQNSNDKCQAEVNLSWSLRTKQDVCLLHNEHLLKCWENSKVGSFVYKTDVQFETEYYLINRESGVEIATTKVVVQSSNTRAQRRRLRTPWSFF
jgi:hypothetical protein